MSAACGRIFIASAAFAFAVSAQAQTTPALASAQQPAGSIAHFLSRADRLMSLGPLAMAAPDAQRLKAEVIDAAHRYKSRNDAQRKAGTPRRSCPPESGDLDPHIWLAHLRSYPAPRRSQLSVHQAFEHYMEKHFPCRSS